jgi:hypothetical protein
MPFPELRPNQKWTTKTARPPLGKAPKSKPKPKYPDHSRMDWQIPFLKAYRKTGHLTKSCSIAGVVPNTVYRAAKRDEKFRRAWELVKLALVDDIEEAGRRRAIEDSDRLVEFFLKAHRPQKYRDNVKVEHTGPGGGPIQVQVPPDSAERSARATQLLSQVAALDSEAGTPNGSGNGKVSH